MSRRRLARAARIGPGSDSVPPFESHDADPASDALRSHLGEQVLGHRLERARDPPGPSAVIPQSNGSETPSSACEGALAGDAMLDMTGKSRELAPGKVPDDESARARLDPGNPSASMARPRGASACFPTRHETTLGSPHSSWRPILIIVDGGSLDHRKALACFPP